MNSIKKVFLYFFSSLILLMLLLGLFALLLFKSPSFQTYITQKVGDYLSEKTNTQITIKGVDFKWVKTLVLKEVLILDHHKDTLLFGKELSVGIDTYSIKNQDFSIGTFGLENTYVNLQKYAGEDSTNLQYFVARLKLKKQNKSKGLEIILDKLVLKNVKFRYWNHNKDFKSFGVDYNHLLCKSVNGEIENISYRNDSVNLKINNLSLKERSGFVLKNLKGNTLVCSSELTIDDMSLQSSKTNLNGKLSFSYNTYSDFKDFVNKVKVQSKFSSSLIYGTDLSYFVPKLKGLNDSISFSGEITGKVNRLKLKNIVLRYGELSYFKGELSFDGLPDIANTFIYIDIKELRTIESDLINIPLPPFDQHKHIKTPEWFNNLGLISFSGKYSGFPSDFVADGNFETECGVLITDVKFNKDENQNINISGSVNSQKFNLGSLLNQKKLGRVTFIGDVNSVIKDKKFNVVIKGEMPLLDFNTYSYSGIKVDGKLSNTDFAGNLSVRDTNLIFDFNGGIDFSKKLQQYNFSASVQKANLHNLGWIKRDSSTSVSFNLKTALSGNKIEEIYGDLSIDNFVWTEKNKTYLLDKAIVKSIKTESKELISLESDWITARIEGNYSLKDLYPSLLNILSRDLPSLVNWKYSQSAFKGKNDYRLMFKINNYNLIRDLFTPKLDFKNAQFSGAFNDKIQQFQLNFYADTIIVGNKNIDGVKVNAHNKEKRINLVASSNLIHFSDTVGIKNFNLNANSSNNSIDYQLGWNNQSVKQNFASINGKMGIAKLDSVWMQVNKMDMVLDDKLWSIHPNNSVVFSPDKINFYNFSAFSNQQNINVNGFISKKENNQLKIVTQSFDLDNFAPFFLKYKTDVRGLVSGDIFIQGALANPIIKADIVVDSCSVNQQKMGKIVAKSNYFHGEGRVALDVSIQNKTKVFEGNTLELKGDYYPFKNGGLDLELNLSNLRIQFFEKYFAGVFSDFKRGKTSGVLKIKGNIKEPEIYGTLRLFQMNFKVDYLNVDYAINAQDVIFNKDLIQFKNFELRHNQYQKSLAVVNGTVKHKAFRNFTYSMDSIRIKDFICLNTSLDNNSSYYGTAFANGLLSIKGNGKKNTISGTISSTAYEDKITKGTTQLNLPLGEIGELQSTDFIHFVKLKDVHKNDSIIKKSLDLSSLEMNFNFIVNEDATVKIIFDPKVGDEVEVNGKGNINMKINTEGRFLMSGKYEIEKGKYFFTLKNFIGKRFIVEKGGTISWDGDPLLATININTYYQSRAKLIDLSNPNASNIDDLKKQFSNRIPVNANILLSGNLMQPDVSMSVTLPDALPNEQEFLATNLIGEDEVNRQVFALLLTNQFLPTSSGSLIGAVNVGTGIDNGLQFLQGQLNNALGGVLNNVDLGVNYNSSSSAKNDTLSNNELRLLLGFKYKNVSLKTDYDINNNAGEILAEYKITNRLKAKAYRRTTEQIITDNGTHVTQGVGLLYQKSFDHLKELFIREEKKKVTKKGEGAK